MFWANSNGINYKWRQRRLWECSATEPFAVIRKFSLFLSLAYPDQPDGIRKRGMNNFPERHV
jgi:hypothetical protein